MKKKMLLLLLCLLFLPWNISARDAAGWKEKAAAVLVDQSLSDSARIAAIAELTWQYAAYYHILNDEMAVDYLHLVQPLLPEQAGDGLNVLIYRPLLMLSADEESEQAFRRKYIGYITRSADPLIRYKGWMALGQTGIYNSSALEYLFRALNEVKADAYKKEQAAACQYISYYYSLHRNRENQLKYALRSVELAKEAGDTRQLIASWKDLGSAYFEDPARHPADKALEAYNQALALFRDVVRIQEADIRSFESLEYMEVLVMLGSIYQTKNQPDVAIRYLLAALKIARANQLPETMAFCHKETGMLYLTAADYPNAEKHLLDAEELLANNNSRTQESEHIGYEIQLMLGHLYRETGQYQASALRYRTGIGQYRQLFDEEIMNENQQAAARYEDARRDEEIAGLTTIVGLKERQKYYYGGIAAVLALALFTSLRLYRYKLTAARQDEQQWKDEAALLALETSNAGLQARLRQEEASRLEQELAAGHELIRHRDKALGNLKKFIDAHTGLSGYKARMESIILQQNRIESNVGEIATGWKDVPAGFYSHLQKQAGDKLTPLDLKYCRLIYLKTPSKQMAAMLFVDPATVRINKYRLKRKLRLTPEDDLHAFIENIIPSNPVGNGD